NNSSEIELNNSSNEISNNSNSVNENLSVNNLILTDQIENVPKYLISFLVEDAIIIETKLSGKICVNTKLKSGSANDHISTYAHATERNRKTLSGSQTQ
ncbi:hypothetical protein PIROE2DRAFT_8862, partial [Piromyces sp. E2]